MDIAKFSVHFMDNIIGLRRELKDKIYKHGNYFAFKINDPKPRDIHKASVRDRIVHHAIYRIIYPYFERIFTFDSYSCRRNKGAHKAINRFGEMARKVSHNNTETVWVLKCDIRRFFANINHRVLKDILAKHIEDKNTIWLLGEVIDSFHTTDDANIGLPLGNVTSQLFINIYMNEFDHFVKRKLKVRYYIRYCDDFVILEKNKQRLINLIPKISDYLEVRLGLKLHSEKVFIKPLTLGVDFLGWIHFTHHRVLRTATKRRMLRKLKLNRSQGSLASYLGLLRHGNTYKLTKAIVDSS